MGPLEWFVSTPAFHHWHHTFDGPINKNYASMLPWMDRIFGTYYSGKQLFPTRYGVEGIQASGIAGQLLDPLLPAVPTRQPSKLA